MRNAIIYWTKKSEAQGFRKWADNHHEKIEDDLKIELDTKECHRRGLVKLGKVEEQQ
jgi:hypothetical protein